MVSFLVCFAAAAAAEKICNLYKNIFCQFCCSVTSGLHLHLIKSSAAALSISHMPVRNTYF